MLQLVWNEKKQLSVVLQKRKRPGHSTIVWVSVLFLHLTAISSLDHRVYPKQTLEQSVVVIVDKNSVQKTTQHKPIQIIGDEPLPL